MSEQTRPAGRERRPQKPTSEWSRLLPFALLGILVAIGIALIVYGTQSSAGTPRLQLDKDVIDFGDQHLNTTVRATFKITNAGDGALVLTVPKLPTVVQGCWPGELVVGQTTLQPGQSTTITTDFMMHEGMDGKHLFEIPLKTNDPTQQTKTLQIKSNWIP